MTEPTSNPELLRSLGRLARGLSCLFWGLPLALVVCVLGLQTDMFVRFGVLPPMITTGLLLLGIWQLGSFQPQERIWITAQFRAQFLATVLFGLSPFLYWSGRTLSTIDSEIHTPLNLYFALATILFHVCAIGFLGALNTVIARLGAMLPDETLRLESRQFAVVNHWLLWTVLITASLLMCIRLSPGFPSGFPHVRELILQNPDWLSLPFLLLVVAMTMSLLWKTKEVALESVYGGGR